MDLSRYLGICKINLKSWHLKSPRVCGQKTLPSSYQRFFPAASSCIAVSGRGDLEKVRERKIKIVIQDKKADPVILSIPNTR